MSSSLFTGVSGLRAHQDMLDVVGNNLANLNTTGFKEQRVNFSDLLYETLAQAAGSTSATSGGTDPLQIGLGVKTAAIETNLTHGSLEATGGDFDLAIQGSGYFVVNNGTEDLYTRAGAFGLDERNFLVDPATGFRVQRVGTLGEGNATNPVFQTPGDTSIKVPFGTSIAGKETSLISLQGNLSAAAVGPLANTLTSAQPFKAAGVAASLTTPLNSLDGIGAAYAAGDVIRIQGTDAGSAAVNTTFTVAAGSKLGDLVNAINAAFPNSTASLDAAGNLALKANTTGPATMALTLSDKPGITGSFPWTSHGMTVTVNGKNGDTQTTAIQVFDTQGTAHNLTLVFTKQTNNVWDLSASINGSEGTMIDGSVQGITFNDDGSFRQVSGSGLGDPKIQIQINGLAVPQTINFSFGTGNQFNGLTQYGGASSAAATNQDGYAAGSLNRVSITKDGIIQGIFTNGRTLSIAQLAIASFTNPQGLNRVGNNYFSLSTESGLPLLGAGQSGGRGALQQGTLESSNVDVALEFTRMITAQRGFQVNARTITVSDQMLQELANIIR